jgi:hypothetical protein
MQSTVRTVYAAYLQTCQLLGLPIVLKPNSTLNEKFNIHSNISIADSDRPSMKYLSIGIGGHRMVTGTNGIGRPEVVQHSPRNAALYSHLPFVLRLPNDDLLANERAKYRLRRLESHDGTVYVAYYLKVLDMTATLPQLELRTVVDNITTATEFNPTLADLNPTPPAINSSGVLTTTGDYIAATGKVPFVMTADEITELLNVANIIYGDEGYAMISEFALCSGVDRTVIGDFNGTSVAYTDAIGVQVLNFVSQFIHVPSNNNGINIELDVGSVEPLLALV